MNHFILCYVFDIYGIQFQADPTDPDAFPFVLLGNKIDAVTGDIQAVCVEKFYLSCN